MLPDFMLFPIKLIDYIYYLSGILICFNIQKLTLAVLKAGKSYYIRIFISLKDFII
jgi:hypothetical protein